MCGIVGYVGHRSAANILLDALNRLQYRGYDSCGIVLVGPDDGLIVEKKAGKLAALTEALGKGFPESLIGIGHTRWATHGAVTDDNAHPHLDCEGHIAVVHNGIVENYLELKRELVARGHTFRSQTDSEVLSHLIEEGRKEGQDLHQALCRALRRVQGSHALLVMDGRQPGHLAAARIGYAGGLVVGYGEAEMYIASDLPALLPYTRRAAYLESGETAEITPHSATFFDLDGKRLDREPRSLAYDPVTVAKGGYRHFMLKEIWEQPEVLTHALQGRVDFDRADLTLEDFPWSPEEIRSLRRVFLVGCGTSYHAALVGRYYMENLAGLPAEVETASEFRYRGAFLGPQTLVVAIGQSGETADTLAAMEGARNRGAPVLALCNVEGSQATRLAQATIYLRAGLEVGVASTKTFMASLATLYLLALYLGKLRSTLGTGEWRARLLDLVPVPHALGDMLAHLGSIEGLAGQFHRQGHFLYLGRGIHYPIALEGALKLKEISYIHAEGYPAGEMKHGPIALIEGGMPVMALAPRTGLYGKMVSNMEEAKARGATVIAVATEGDRELAEKMDHVIYIPQVSPWLTPLLAVVPLQLLAYHLAVLRGCDVDQPRNLAKSVTVE
ncbi:MAG: glutamine--fructose-6-phosphate transaminase (isomerizing) [Chloroflexi bacterium]|nr:glutamine--fructose-6-phosphate transaminase (isomerizing) [Chloroflexota bacterium]